MTFGEEIKKARTERGMSRPELAKKAGISTSRLQGIENEDAANITLKTFVNLCNALNLRPAEFLGLWMEYA